MGREGLKNYCVLQWIYREAKQWEGRDYCVLQQVRERDCVL